ncbi:dihydroxyacetone kinase subunit DhaK, partial [Streptomyces albiflaviniger]|nr:dihydroxyacetone kinase subunit DhaK [Streptomyces albiflaviniger]
PGVSEDTLGTAEDLARALVTGLLADRPAGVGDGGRVAVVLNGLGATKYEELYVLWGAVARQLDEAGLMPVRPEVGELVTSLDMAGCSLTLSWLDEELERLWLAPADTPAFCRTAPPEPPLDDSAVRSAAAPRRPERSAATASGAAVEVAELAVHALRAARDVLHRDAEDLGRLDAVAGDGDHGRGMSKGVDAALAAAEQAHTDRLAPAAVLAAAGDAWAAEAGGTSGALWGVGLRAIGAALPAD